MREGFQHICIGFEIHALWQRAIYEDFVEQNEVMGRPDGALNSHVGLQEEIPIARFGNAAISDGTADWIRRPSINLSDAVPSNVHGGRIKARIVTFPYDDECDAW